ncbi:MAG: DUF262 domain-containing protein [Armatimonadetes bacterium]|nr:DUF262 domain-containing protein [Armatimonadota bacterium]
MAFQTPLTIKEALQGIQNRTYLLPAIQRELVWNTDQIEMLFDSILRRYPIGSFLFWHVDREHAGDYQFYDFMLHYHERDNRHSQPVASVPDRDVTAVLDGQQRLTALYLGLHGTYAEKAKWARWNNPQAFPKKQLHMNLRAPASAEDENRAYDFRFLTPKEATAMGAATWYPVGEVLTLASQRDVQRVLARRGLADDDFAADSLFGLFEAVHQQRIINYYLEKDQDLDKVLNIFIRVNSGGTQLSYSDLLLSTATAQWTTIDARQDIHSFVDELNAIGQGFAFTKDFVLKASLVLTDLPTIGFKVSNFTKANMSHIEQQWDGVKDCLRQAVRLVASFGFNRDTLTSTNAIIPVAYYLRRSGAPGNYDEAKAHEAERQDIRRWLIAALLKRAFGGQADTVLLACRNTIARHLEGASGFPVQALNSRLHQLNKSLTFTAADIAELVTRRWNWQDTFLVLGLLYPHLDYRNLFHQDHIHPRSLCTPSHLRRLALPEGEISFIHEHRDELPNLQLLPSTPNLEKSNRPFQEWFDDLGPDDRRQFYREQHLIPNVSLALADFRTFFEARRQLIIERLSGMLWHAPAAAAGDNAEDDEESPGGPDAAEAATSL